MKEQWTEGEGGTLGRDTERPSLFGTNAINRVRAQPPDAMRTAAESDRSIVDRAQMKCERNSEHAHENVDRR
jgi:hypothetical protein